MGLRIVFNFGLFRGLEADLDRPWNGVISAALGLAYALAERGHEIHIFAEATKDSLGAGVRFHDRTELAAFGEATDVDVFVAIPPLLPLLMPIHAKARVVWTGNGYSKGDGALSVRWNESGGADAALRSIRLYRMSTLEPYLDLVVTGSKWQAKRLHERAGIPRDKIAPIHLGVTLQYYRDRPAAWHRHRLIFTSSSRYGLDPLLEMFPRIRQSVPNAELHIFGCEYTSLKRLREREAQLASGQETGIYWRGAVGKSALASELTSAALMAYPNLVKETFSLAVAEAQAAGLPIVTSRRGALRERVTDGVDGFLIRGNPDQAPYQKAFLEAVNQLLSDDELWQRMSTNAATKAGQEYDWQLIASQWERKLEPLTAGRSASLPPIGPALDLLDSSLLNVVERTYSLTVTPEKARNWLQTEWASYGYDPDRIPGLRPG